MRCSRERRRSSLPWTGTPWSTRSCPERSTCGRCLTTRGTSSVSRSSAASLVASFGARALARGEDPRHAARSCGDLPRRSRCAHTRAGRRQRRGRCCPRFTEHAPLLRRTDRSGDPGRRSAGRPRCSRRFGAASARGRAICSRASTRFAFAQRRWCLHRAPGRGGGGADALGDAAAFVRRLPRSRARSPFSEKQRTPQLSHPLSQTGGARGARGAAFCRPVRGEGTSPCGWA